jgi:eukaryotic-like serine/threonine-protein kinase
MAVEIGQLFGNYRMVRLLGEGGFGEVYLVENPLIGRRAAVKVLHTALAQEAELVRRFLNEARAASAIRHPNIIDVLDAGGTADGAPYILMEFLEGVSLQKRLEDRGRLALPQVLDIARQAGSALSAAHAAGIVHRDLKPENLFLVPDTGAPGGEKVKVLDFGIAKIKHGSSSGGTVKTQSGVIMGSPAYMSPEQCKDSADVDLRSDVYSFATILYEMLAGGTPHVAATGTEMLVMHLTATPRPLRELAADVPAHVEAAIMRGLARARDDRFDGMTSFLEALQGGTASGTMVLSTPVKMVSAANANPEIRLERTIALPAATTFSRASGQVAVTDDDDQLFAPKRPRRWRFVAIGCVAAAVVAAGVGLLMLVPTKPSHDSTAPAAPVAEPAKAVELVQQELPQPAAVLPSKLDASVVPSAQAVVEPTAKSERVVVAPPPARRRPRQLADAVPPKPPEPAKPDPGTSVQTPKKPAGVAGF